MNRLLRPTKGGESVILGYVLLVVLAIGMSAAVYAYLKWYIPKNQPQCPEGASLIITNTSCDGSTFTISVLNKGLFSINGSYIKVGTHGRTYKTVVNCPGPDQRAPACQLYFNAGPPAYLTRPLHPGESWTRSFAYNGTGDQEIELEPLVIADGSSAGNRSRVLCANAIVTTSVRCGN